MAYAEATILQIKADITNALRGISQVQKGMADLNKTASGVSITGTAKSFRQIEQYGKLIGDSSGVAKEKIGLLESSLRKMTEAGEGGSKKAEQLSKYLLKLKGDAGQGSSALNVLSNILKKNIPAYSQVSGAVEQLGEAFPKLATMAGPAALAIAAVAAAYKAVIIPGVQFNAMLEQQEIAFTAMLKSGTSAAYMMEDLKKLSLTTPIGLGEGASSAKQLLAYGFAQKEIIDNLKMMKTVAAAVNVPLNDLTYVYGTLRAQGRAYTRDIMQFAMRGIPIYEYLAQTLGVSVSEIKKLTEEGKVGFKEVEAAMRAMTGEGGKFHGMLEASMGTTQGLQTQIKNTWDLFTGEAAKGSSEVFKQLLKDILKMIQQLQQIAPTINVMFTALSVAGYAVIKVLMMVVQPIIDLIKWIQETITYIAKMSKAWWDFGENVKNMNLKDAASNWFSDMGKAWDNLWDKMVKYYDFKDKKEGKSEFVAGSFSQAIPEGSKRAQDLSKMFHQTKVDAETLGKYLSTGLGKDWGASVTDAVNAIAKMRNLTQSEYDKLLRDTKTAYEKGQGYWRHYADDVMTSMGLAGSSIPTSIKDALDNVENVLKGSSGLRDAEYLTKVLGLSPKEAKESISNATDKIAAELKAQMDKMAFDPKFLSGEGKDFLDGITALWRKYSTSTETGGKKAEKKTEVALDDILAKYADFRAKIMTEETGFDPGTKSLLESYLGEDAIIKGQFDIYDREIRNINRSYEDMFRELFNSDQYSPEKFALVVAMRAADVEAIKLNKRIAQITGDLAREASAIDMSTNIKDSLAAHEAQYQSQLEMNQAVYEQEVAQGNINALINKQAADADALVEKYRGMADELKGANAQSMADRIANPLFEQGAAERASGDYLNGIGNTIAASITSTLGGTEMASLMGMGDPITSLIAALVSAATSIENFSKVLNWASTIAEGMISMWTYTVKVTSKDDPKKTETKEMNVLGDALASTVKFLTKIGEVIGALLLPVIEVVGDQLDVLMAPLTVLAEIIKRLFVALKPLFKIILYIAQPLNLLGLLFADFANALGALVQTTEDQTKDLEDMYAKELATLQNLYEVGALSIAQYEERLAALKARYATDTEAPAADPALVQMLTDLFDAIDVMGDALQGLWNTIKDTLGALWNAIAPYIGPLLKWMWNTFIQTIISICNIITNIANAFSALCKGDVAGFFKGMGDALYVLFMAIMRALFNPIIGMFNAIINFFSAGNIPQAIPPLATGTGNVPFDMTALLHQGESVIPKTFMDSIRNGDLALSAPGASGGGNVYVTVYNEGSVITERELNRTIYEGISSIKKKGYV